MGFKSKSVILTRVKLGIDSEEPIQELVWTSSIPESVPISQSEVINIPLTTNNPSVLTIVAGSLPSGLSIVGNAISGTVITAGATYSVTIRATDGNDQTIEATIEMYAYDPHWGNVELLVNASNDSVNTVPTDKKFGTTIVRNYPSNTATGYVSNSNQLSGFGNNYFNRGSQDQFLKASRQILLDGDFTIEYWAYFTQLPTWSMCVANYASSHDPNNLMTGMSNNRVYFGFSVGDANNISGSTNIALNTWVHFAFVRKNNVVNIYVDGMLDAQKTISRTYGTTENAWTIGGYTYSPTNWQMYGHMDDIRITKGVARYDGDFDVPTTSFPARGI